MRQVYNAVIALPLLVINVSANSIIIKIIPLTNYSIQKKSFLGWCSLNVPFFIYLNQYLTAITWNRIDNKFLEVNVYLKIKKQNKIHEAKNTKIYWTRHTYSNWYQWHSYSNWHQRQEKKYKHKNKTCSFCLEQIRGISIRAEIKCMRCVITH